MKRRARPLPARLAPLAACFAVASLAACFATPTPLAPGLDGSVGWPHYGVQTGAIELPESGEGFARYRSTGGFYWGQPALVDGLRAAARRVADELPGGPPLVVGDLSSQFGGKIARHYSHRSGRDVDLLWFVTTLEGKPLQNSAFVQLDQHGVGRIAGRSVRLDTEREWRLIRALLTSPHLEVQWLYSSSLVKGLILEHALAAGEAPALLARARVLMQEPLDSLPHDDHLHLRMACPPESRGLGCEGGGPDWSVLVASAEAPESAALPELATDLAHDLGPVNADESNAQ
ncbi:MAG TPA: penicillin-insensitive murein endopeptidase [Polyangiaceae bacterium]|nr:penicillin-insensitive murein endopeptidase [Polyangiaceae bacterium]